MEFNLDSMIISCYATAMDLGHIQPFIALATKIVTLITVIVTFLTQLIPYLLKKI